MSGQRVAGIVLVFLFAAAVFAQRPVNINDAIDNQLEGHNKLLIQRNITSLPLPDGEINGIKFVGGRQHGAHTMQRTGEGTVERISPDSISYKYRIGYKELSFTFQRIEMDGKTVEGPKLTVGKNSMAFDFTVKNGTSCNVILDNYKFTELEEVKGEGLNGDTLAEVSKVLLDHVNSSIEKKKPQVEQHLQPLCGGPHHGPVTAEPSHAVTFRPPVGK